MNITNTVCEAYEVFDLALKLLELRAVDLSRESGVSTSSISRYRKGLMEMGSSDFVSLVRVLPEPAQSLMLDVLQRNVTKEEVLLRLSGLSRN